MMFRKIGSVLFSCLLLVGLSACGGTPATEQPAETTTTTLPTVTTVAIFENDLAAMLTKQDLTDALGIEMNEPTVSNQGTELTSIAVEEKIVLNVELSEKPIEVYNMALQNYTDLTPCPNLGDTAWYSPMYNQLMVYGKGYMFLVELLGYDNTDKDMPMLRSRQVAALLLERL